MRPGTMRSTSVEQNTFSSLTHLRKSSDSFQSSMYWLTHFSSSLPLLSISSQESITMPGLPAVKRSYSTRVSLAGKLWGGTWSKPLSLSWTMPASVVLDTMISRSSLLANSRTLSHSP